MSETVQTLLSATISDKNPSISPVESTLVHFSCMPPLVNEKDQIDPED